MTERLITALIGGHPSAQCLKHNYEREEFSHQGSSPGVKRSSDQDSSAAGKLTFSRDIGPNQNLQSSDNMLRDLCLCFTVLLFLF